MGKIPTVSFGDRPSAVPTGPGTPATSIPDIMAASKTVSGALEDVAATKERESAVRLYTAMKAKQGIKDEIDATQRGGDYEEGIRGLSESLQKKYWDNPDGAVPDFIEGARALADQAIHDAPNTAVGLKLSETVAARLHASTDELHSWAEARTSQKMKGDLAVMANRVSAGAEGLGSSDALAQYLDKKQAELKPLFEKVHGNAAVQQMAEMKTDATRSWLLTLADKDPLAAKNVLDSAKGPVAENLNTSQREAARKDIVSSFEGYAKQQHLRSLQGGLRDVDSAYKAVLDGSANSAMFLSLQNKNEEQRRVVLAQTNEQLPPDQKKAQLANLDKTSKALGTLNTVYRSGLAFDAEDDEGVRSSLLAARKDLFKTDKGINGKDLSKAMDFRDRLVAAYGDKKLTQNTFNTLYGEFSLAFPAATANEEGNTTRWGADWFPESWKDPRRAGNTELETRFNTGSFSGASPADRNRAEVKYIQLFNEATHNGVVVTPAQARKFALQALSRATGRQIPGVDH